MEGSPSWMSLRSSSPRTRPSSAPARAQSPLIPIGSQKGGRSGGSRIGGDERCQKPICIKEKADLKDECKRLSKDHRKIKSNFDAQVKSEAAGVVRQVLADLTIAQRENETLRYELRQVTKKRDYARRREAECVDLLADPK